MAEPIPGQVVTPSNDANNQPQRPVASTQEVSVNVPQAIPAKPPASVVNPVEPQQQPAQPYAAPASMPSAQPPLQQPLATNQVQATSMPQVPIVEAPGVPEPAPPTAELNESFAPQFDIQDQTEREYQPSSDAISWTASEYIAHQKSALWYLALGIASILFAVLVYFITNRDILSVVVVLLAATVLGIYAAKKPREQHYSISASGVSIGPKIYSYGLLKTFSIINEGAFSSITFLPLKRFMPAISIYYDPQDEEKIVETLSNYLPMDVQKRDVVDNFMRRIRF